MIPFSDTTGNTGIVQRVRKRLRVDSIQWPTVNIANSANDWLDFVTGYAIGADHRFQWDDTNHTALPEGTQTLTINVSDYSFLTDQQGNRILTLLGVSIYDSVQGKYRELREVDRDEENTATFGTVSGTADQITKYDKIADNVIRLDILPSATVAAGIKFFFQRSPSYFVDTDTTKQPGVAPMLHRGFEIAAAYDGALSLGRDNLQALAVEREKEEQKMIRYFSIRNQDVEKNMTMARIQFR